MFELKKTSELSFRPLCLDRSKRRFEVHDHMVYSISKISEFQNKEGNLPINTCGEICSIPIGGACSLCGCTRYIYLECPIEERLLWKGLAYHECPRLHESLSLNAAAMSEDFKGWEERQSELWAKMLIAVHRAQQRIDKEKMKFENQYRKAVFKDSSNHNLRDKRLRDMPKIVQRLGLQPCAQLVIVRKRRSYTL